MSQIRLKVSGINVGNVRSISYDGVAELNGEQLLFNPDENDNYPDYGHGDKIIIGEDEYSLDITEYSGDYAYEEMMQDAHIWIVNQIKSTEARK